MAEKNKNEKVEVPLMVIGDAPSEVKEIPVREPTVVESVASRIKSRSAKPVILDGRASRFDLKRYGDHDFTAGGQLQPRFVAKADDRISQLQAEGYDFPQNWDPRLPPIEVSGMVLMLRTSDHAHQARKWHLDNARALDRSKAPTDTAQSIAPDKRDGAKFMGPDEEGNEFEKPQDVTLGANTQSRVMGPE